MRRESRPNQADTLLAVLGASGEAGVPTNVLRSQHWIGNPSERRLAEFAPPELRGAALVAVDDDGQTRLAA